VLGFQKNLNAVMSYHFCKLPTLRVMRMKMKMVLVGLSLAHRWGVVGFVGGVLLRVSSS